jgi:hypothetical protein
MANRNTAAERLIIILSNDIMKNTSMYLAVKKQNIRYWAEEDLRRLH